MPEEITFLATGDIGPTHGPNDGYPVERYSELVEATITMTIARG